MKRSFTILTAAIALLACLAIPMGMKGQTTVTQTSFTAISGNVNNDTKVSFAAYKGGGTSNPAANSGALRLYQNSNSQTGGYVVIGVTSGYQITSATIQSTMATTTGYKLTDTDPGSTTPAKNTFNVSNYSLSANTDYTVSDISTQYITFACFGTSSSSRLYLSKISVTYESTGSQTTTYTVTYHANVTGVSNIEVEYNEGDDVTVAANTFSNPGYAFTKWNTLADGTGTDYDPYDVIEDIDADIDLYAQWEASTSTTGTIKFGSSTGHVKINAASVTGDDDINNEWTITTVGTTSFTQASTYSQVGSSSSPATSITFTTTLPEEVNVTAMEVKFGGFSGTAGTITMKVGNQTIGTGSLNATNDVVVNSSSTATGDVLTVTVTNIAKGVKCYYISYTYEEATPNPAVATTTTITVPSDFNADIHNGTSAGTLTATVTAGGSAVSGATVTWSSSDAGVATIAANGAVTLVAVGTTTITANYAGVEDQYRPSSDTYELTVTDSYAPGTVNNPYTVAQACAAIDANTGITGVYATGIVSQVDSYSNNTITYWISDDGTNTNQLEVYKGKNLNNTNFTALSDIEVGATVIVYGTLKKHNEIYEFNSGNYLTSYTAPVHAVEAPTFSLAAGTFTTAQTITISSATTGVSIYYTTDGTEPDNTSTQYTSALTISTTTTIKAVAYDGTNYSNVTTATYHFCSAEDPYTVTEALAFNEYPANNIYVSGIVSTAPTSNPSSGKLIYYISVDGEATNQLEVYQGKGLNDTNFSSKDDIQVGDIVTVYGNVVIYNNTKEFAQGNYLVSFERPAQQYNLTVTPSANVEIFTFVGDDPTQEGQAGAFTTQVYDDTTVGISVSAEEGYVLTLIVDGTDVTSQLDETGWYEFTMPAHDVTVTATASLAPVVTTNTYTLATSIESGKQYIIVGKADSKYYAMGYNKGNNRHGVEITSDGTTANATIANSETNAHEFTISSLGEGYYSIMDATTSGGYLYAASSSGNQLKTETTLDENHNGDWNITINAETGVASVVADQSSNHNVMQFNTSGLFNCYSSASQHPVYLYVKDETPIIETETYTLTINGYGDNTTGGWYLIASPVATTPDQVTNMITDETEAPYSFDLYRFNQNAEMEWENYHQHQNDFNIVPGQGYLYANKGNAENTPNEVTLTFIGTPYSGNGEVELTYSETNTDAKMHGWNLVGNPFTERAYIGDRSFYVMNDGGEIITAERNYIEPMEGIFVIAEEDGETLTFSTEDSKCTSKLVMNLNNNRGNAIDRAIVRFGEGRQLPKFQLRENSTKLYIPQEGNDYAVVRSEGMGDIPVNFKAEDNGTYTLTFNNEEVNFNYLHLIDNKTGNNVDLMANPSYTFEANVSDYANRFRLVFSANSINEQVENEEFAFFNGNAWVINNNGVATLQVIDMSGRVLSTETVNGNATTKVNAATGVYMLRLTNGNVVKTQKVVVK